MLKWMLCAAGILIAVATNMALAVPTGRAASATPRVLIQAGQCLVAKNFMEPQKGPQMILGYDVDDQSYTGQRVVYVVEQTDRTSSSWRGLVFAVFCTKQEGHLQYDIQNNARFVSSKAGVDWVDNAEPLGGNWTQQHLINAIKRIERGTTFEVLRTELATVDPAIRCRAYTDQAR